MKKYFLLLTTLMTLVTPAHAKTTLPTDSLSIETQSGQTVPFEVEIVDTEESQKKGLMFRESLKPKSGMLFIFKEPTEPEFWMKDTYIYLDLIYIDEFGYIVDIFENATPNNLTPISSPGPIVAVLEITGGASKTLGITKGDKVNYKIFEKDLK